MAGESHESRRADVLIVSFGNGPGSVRDLDELLTDAVDRVRKVAGVESATLFAALPFGRGIHRPPISVPGVGDASGVSGNDRHWQVLSDWLSVV